MHLEFSTWSIPARRMSSRLVIFVLAALACTSLVACKKGPDASTPKKAAAIFAKAAQAGDMETLHQVATGTDAEFELTKGLGQMTQAFGRFSKAASDKFGTEANTKNMTLDIGTVLESADEKIDGDSATLISKSDSGEESEPIHLKKDGSNWKVDLSFLDKDAAAKDFSDKMPGAAKVWDQAAQEVEAGKFEKFVQASAAVKFRLNMVRLGEAAGKVEAARADLASFDAALELYKNDAAEYPQGADGLLALTQKPATATNWHGPYLKTTIVNDPWGHPYIYVVPGLHNANTFDLSSMGPDGKDGTADDINNWAVETGK